VGIVPYLGMFSTWWVLFKLGGFSTLWVLFLARWVGFLPCGVFFF